MYIYNYIYIQIHNQRDVKWQILANSIQFEIICLVFQPRKGEIECAWTQNRRISGDFQTSKYWRELQLVFQSIHKYECKLEEWNMNTLQNPKNQQNLPSANRTELGKTAFLFAGRIIQFLFLPSGYLTQPWYRWPINIDGLPIKNGDFPNFPRQTVSHHQRVNPYLNPMKNQHEIPLSNKIPLNHH